MAELKSFRYGHEREEIEFQYIWKSEKIAGGHVDRHKSFQSQLQLSFF